MCTPDTLYTVNPVLSPLEKSEMAMSHAFHVGMQAIHAGDKAGAQIEMQRAALRVCHQRCRTPMAV